MSKLRIGSCFSGIGAWEKALTNLNISHNLQWFFENDSHAEISYCAIHNIQKELNKGDITKANVDELDDIDVLVYSPPCQSFSTAGKQLGFEDDRGILFFDALKIIKSKKPKYALMENVIGLTQNKFKKEFEFMIQSLEKAGYNNHWQVLNAKDYNVPQNRDRVFIVSIRDDIDDKNFEFPKPISLTKQLKDVVNIDFDEVIDKRIMESCKHVFYDEYEKMLVTNKEIYQCKADSGWQDKKVGITVSPALRANKTHTCVMVEGKIKRLDARDMFLLMGFSKEDLDNARNAGVSDAQLMKQAGNSIVVNVLEEIFKNLFKLDNKYIE